MSRKQNKSKEFFESRDKFEREVKRPKTRSAYIPQLVKKTNNKRIWDQVLSDEEDLYR